jgi:hypothetical protein
MPNEALIALIERYLQQPDGRLKLLDSTLRPLETLIGYKRAGFDPSKPNVRPLNQKSFQRVFEGDDPYGVIPVIQRTVSLMEPTERQGEIFTKVMARVEEYRQAVYQSLTYARYIDDHTYEKLGGEDKKLYSPRGDGTCHCCIRTGD